MRAISSKGQYGIVLKHPRTRRGLDGTGTVVEYSEGDTVHAQFHKGGLTEWEEQAAYESFDFSGLAEGVNPITQVSMFDTEAYVEHLELSAVEKAALLAELDERLVYLSKLFPNDFRIVAKPAAPRPWPSYDGDAIEEILAFQERLLISPETIRLYEVENRNRDEVIESMEAIEAAAAGVPYGDAQTVGSVTL